MVPEPEQFIGKYADIDLESGVENVKERIDREFREWRTKVGRLVRDD